jgi:hypothetical protein
LLFVILSSFGIRRSTFSGHGPEFGFGAAVLFPPTFAKKIFPGFDPLPN